MGGNTLFRPLAAAFSLALRRESLLALVLLIAVAAGSRAIQTQGFQNASPESFIWISLSGTFGPAVINAALIYFLARALLVSESGRSPPLLLRALGLYLMTFGLTYVLSTVGTIAIFTGDPSPFMMTYGSSLVGPLAAIIAFPILVRTFATAAGIAEPTLGSLWTFVFHEGRYAYVWYAVCSVLFTALMVFTFANLLPASNEANELPGNLVQSAISGTGSLLRFMLAIVVAQMAGSTDRRVAEVFA